MSTVLIVLDGWGHREQSFGNAVSKAHTPFFDSLDKTCPSSSLITHSYAVGLPQGQCGNSEVGHLTLGAGRCVPHPRVQITQMLKRAVHSNDIDEKLIPLLSVKGKVHLVGLHSAGGVHGLDGLTYLWCDFFLQHTEREICLHVITDGRDQPYGALSSQLDQLAAFIAKDKSRLSLVSVSGRFYAMDRDNHWDRTELFVQALLGKIPSCDDLLSQSLKEVAKLTPASEEFLKPQASFDHPGIEQDDIVLNMNYRTDRARQWVELLVKQKPNVRMFSTVSLHDNPNYQVLCPQLIVDNTFNDLLNEHGKSQLRATESEKKPHVTYFFDGLTEKHSSMYDQIIIPSHKVESWSSVPKMRADEIAQSVVQALKVKTYDFILVNLTNADLVGHSGDYEAAVEACSHVDKALGKIISCLSSSDHLFVTADHGNAEQMLDDNGLPHTAHTTYPVKFIYKGPFQVDFCLEPNGQIGQVASTLAQSLLLLPKDNWLNSLFK